MPKLPEASSGPWAPARSAGQRYDVLNIEEPTNPHRVGRFELETPGHSIHDVWVENGVAVGIGHDDHVVLRPTHALGSLTRH